MWVIIKNVISRNKSKNKSDQFLSNNKKINRNEFANGFIDYFVNIGPNLAVKITSERPSF